MPKQFGHAVTAFVTIAVVISFTGCRTASTQLAGVPGFGWLNRGDEGWAKYEPAPSLPRPSSTSEPTGGSSPAANIASTGPSTSSDLGSSTRGYDTAPSATGALASKDRFDQRYVPKSGAEKPGSSYASAYGKYKPKSLGGSDASTQAGPYGTDIPKYEPKYASNAATDAVKGYDTSTSYNNSFAGSKYVSPSTPKPAEETPAAAAEEKKAPYGYVANNRFDNAPATTASPAATPKFDAGSSRFGDSAGYAAASPTTPPKTYTPPGFATPSSKKTMGTQFGDVAASAQQQAKSLANSANNQLTATANNAIAEGKKFAGGLASTAQSKVSSATNGLNPPAEFNRFNGGNNSFVSNTANNASKAAGTLASNAQTGVKNLSNGAAEITNKFAANLNNQAAATASQAQASAQQLTNNVKAALPNATAPTTTAPRFGDYAQSAKNEIAAAASAASNAASSTFNNATAQATNFAQGTQPNTTSAINAQVQKASQYAADTYNQFAQSATDTVQNTLQGAVNTPQNAAGSLQGMATQAQQNIEQTVTSTYNQAKNNFEKTAASQYGQAKASVGHYANSAAETVKKSASNLATGVANNETYKSATAKASEYLSAAGNTVSQTVNGAGQTLQSYGNSAVKAGQNVMQNVSAPISAYPTTSTPNPFVVPGNAVSGASRAEVPPATAAPGVFQKYDATPSTSAPGPVHRTATPFLPGSTKSFQGATNTRKPAIELASATKDAVVDGATPQDDHLVLAVGDASQFPRTLR